MNSPEKISRAQGIKKAFQNLNIMVPLWSLAEMSRDYLKKKVLYNSDLSLMQPILLHKHGSLYALAISYAYYIVFYLMVFLLRWGPSKMYALQQLRVLKRKVHPKDSFFS